VEEVEEEEVVEETREPRRIDKFIDDGEILEDTPENLFRRLREILEARGKKV
jgi:hypothetical protein